MKRRDLFTGLLATSGFALGNGLLWKYAQDTFSPSTRQDPLVLGNISDTESARPLVSGPEPIAAAPSEPDLTVVEDLAASPVPAPTARPAGPLTAGPASAPVPTAASNPVASEEARILEKVRNFEQEFSDDIYLVGDERIVLHSVLKRLERAEAFIGHGNYNVSSFDYLFKIADRYPQVGSFTRVELDLIERLFFEDARRYGFMGDKVTRELTASIAEKDILKVPYSGQYIYRGQSHEYYKKLTKDIGDSIILTSGIRSNVKQMHLFLAKAAVSNYNLSKASRSLAPPGHSYHGIGDFDVGKVGWGGANFTNRFAETDEFKRMQDLGYVQIRYTEDNRLGVRFEPWHIKVV